jgi:PKD repeat protein
MISTRSGWLMNRRLSAALLCVAGLIAACRPATLEPLELRMTFTSDRNRAGVGEQVNFVVDSQGNGLLAIRIDFGDGNNDALSTGGARTARATFSHSYAAPGVYVVRARVDEATDTVGATVSVTIDPASPASSIPTVFTRTP